MVDNTERKGANPRIPGIRVSQEKIDRARAMAPSLTTAAERPVSEPATFRAIFELGLSVLEEAPEGSMARLKLARRAVVAADLVPNTGASSEPPTTSTPSGSRPSAKVDTKRLQKGNVR